LKEDAGHGVDHTGVGSCTLRTVTRLGQGSEQMGGKFPPRGEGLVTCEWV
jgi:hypothetical protein